MKARVQHYQDGGCLGPVSTIDYSGRDDVVAWSRGQTGCPWDGVIVTVLDDDGEEYESYEMELCS